MGDGCSFWEAVGWFERQPSEFLDWPDRRLTRYGDDVFLGEAIRQQGWAMTNLGSPGIAMNTEPRRGESTTLSKSHPLRLTKAAM